MDDFSIERESSADGGAYVARVKGGSARLELRAQSDGVMAAVHTETSGSLQGKRVGNKLVERMVDDARAEGTKILALCSFVRHERQKHPEWDDVFVEG